MPTSPLSQDLRKRIVAHYGDGEKSTYLETAALFGVGVATVSRLLRLKRDTGDVAPIPRETKRKHKIDREWLDAHVKAHPDARLKDRAQAFEAERGVVVTVVAIWYAVSGLGYTHKKKRSTQARGTPSESRSCAKRLSRSNL